MRALPGRRTALVAALSLVFTYLFFIEYLRPVRAVNIPYDLPLFHYPLADYAFKAVQQGRFPLWDPTIYSGMPFAANTQAALFYPPTWLLFLANAGRPHLSYWSLQEFVFVHVWLAFVLCYWWLGRRLPGAAALFGAGIFAYSGYMLLQLQHVGFVAGFAWMPLAFMGIDEAVEQRRWVPLWKAAAASAMCFLAGYVPLWVVFAVCAVSYAACRKDGVRAGVGAVGALAVSLLIAMVQLLPAAEISAMKVVENRYGGGIKDPEFYWSFLIPNLFRFGMEVDPRANFGKEYLYLGAPAIAGLLFLVLQRRREREVSGALPLVGTLSVGAMFLVNPFNIVGVVVHSSAFLSQVCRDWYFLAAIPLPVAGLAAIGLHRVFEDAEKVWPAWVALGFSAIALTWTGLGLRRWLPGGGGVAEGWASAWVAAVQLALFAAGLWLLRTQRGWPRAVLLGALALSTAIDYKIHGTSRRFNAAQLHGAWTRGTFEALHPRVYRHLQENRQGRIVVDDLGPLPQLLRHVALATPQGFDPFLTAEYKTLVQELGVRFHTNWEFVVPPSNREALRALGVRFFVTAEQGAHYAELKNDPGFTLLEPSEPYYKVFEYRDAAAPFGFADGGGGAIEAVEWAPERRAFRFAAAGEPRMLYLSEQWAPGWTATVDGAAVPVERWRGAMQAVSVPAGAGRAEFAYRPRTLLWGALVSMLSVLGLAAAALRTQARMVK